MNYNMTISNWISRLSEGDSRAMEYVFTRYFDQLIQLAVRKMHGLNQISRSGEDIALSAIKSLYVGLQNNQIQLRTEDDLWGCLFCITVRKSTAERRREWAAKRGAGKYVYSGDATNDDEDGAALFDTVTSNEPSPELAAQMAENADELLAIFDENSTQREIISMKLQGLTVPEIASRLNLIPRTIFWHLGKIRERWEFCKGIEYLAEGIMEGTPLKKIAVALEMNEEVLRAALNQMAVLWEEESSAEEVQKIRLIWENPQEFLNLLEKRDEFTLQLEKRLGKIAARWGILGRTTWKNILFKIWTKK